jgi:hypothetical protein
METWTCSIETNLQHGHRHAAQTATISIDMAVTMDMGIQHGYGHAAWAEETCSTTMDIKMDIQH